MEKKIKAYVKPNFIDKIVGYVSPRLASNRLLDRVRYTNSVQFLSGLGDNEGYITKDSNKRSMQGWSATSQTPNQDILPKHDSMVASSRDLWMNNPMGRAPIGRLKTNVMGLGLRLKSQIDRDYLDLNEEQAKTWEATAEREWKLWSENKYCDAELTSNLNELGIIAFLNKLLSGSVFVSLPMVPLAGQPYDLKVKLIETDFISNPQLAPDTHRRASGIEFNKLKAPISYWINQPANPDAIDFGPSSYGVWKNVKRFNKFGLEQMLHLFEKERPGQAKGVPLLAPFLEDIKQKGRYKDSSLDAAILNTMFTVFIKSTANMYGQQLEEGFIPPNLANDSTNTQDEKVTDSTSPKDENRELRYEMGRANILQMADDQDISLADPKHPITSYPDFVNALAKDLGAGLNIPYEVLMMEFNKSFSASKAALQEAWKTFLSFRQYMIEHFYRPIYEMWMYEAVLKGHLKAPGFLEDIRVRTAYLKSDWIGQGQGMIDPLKETEASVLKIKNRLSTREKEFQKHEAGDWFGSMNNFAKEDEHLKDLDIYPPEEQMMENVAENASNVSNTETTENSEDSDNDTA